MIDEKGTESYFFKKWSTGFKRYLPWMGGILLILAVGIVYTIRTTPACSQGQEKIGTTVLLIDVSDKLQRYQHQRLKKELLSISAQSEDGESLLNKGERLLVYFLEEIDKEPSKAFDGCYPGNVQDMSWIEWLTKGGFWIIWDWTRFFETILKKVDRKISIATSLDTSPILQTIREVREEFPLPRLMKETDKNQILIWSDMLQNTPNNTPKINHHKKLGDAKSVCEEFPVELEGINIVVFYITSKKYPAHQTSDHEDWWHQVFSCMKSPVKEDNWHRI